MRPYGWRAFCLLMVALVCAAAPARASTQLDALYARILRRPNDTALNLQFARAAEAAGILRVRRKLQPNISQVTVELGSAVETNPRYYIGPKRTEFEGLASAALRDERAVNDMCLHTTGVVAGQFHSKSSDLDYGYLGLNTGPVLDILPGVAMVPAVGGAAAYFDRNFYYGEGALSATFEGARRAPTSRCS